MANQIRKYTCFLVIVFFTAAALINCRNPIQNSDIQEPETGDKPSIIDQGTGQVMLVIYDSRNDSSRTLLPPDPEFTSYRLSFIPLSDQAPVADVTIPSESGATFHNFNMETGKWEIEAYGRINFEGQEQETAYGSSTVTVIANNKIEATITMRNMPPNGDDGIFSWSLTVPAGVDADSYSITLSSYGNESNRIVELNNTINTGTGDVIAGQISCKSGYYVLRAWVGTDRQKVFYYDIAHIVSFRETAFTHIVDPAEFVPVINLSGSANVTLYHNGQLLTSGFNITEVWAYSSTGEKIAYTTEITDGNWKMPVARINQARDVYFSVIVDITYLGNIKIELKSSISRVIYQDDVSAININVSQVLVVLDGTLTVKTNGNIPPSGWEINAYTDSNDEKITILTEGQVKTNDTGYWKIVVGAFSAPAYVCFSVTKTDGGKKYKRVDLSKTSVYESNETVNFTAYFTPPERVWILIKEDNNAGTEGEESPMHPLNSKDRSRFIFTKTNLKRNYHPYFFSILADFAGGDSSPSWNSAGGTQIKYDYSSVIKPSGAITYFDNNGVNGMNYWWNNEEKIAGITIDFSNDKYLETGEPVLKIDKYGELFINGGTFNMGSPATEKGRNGPSGLSAEIPHNVTVSSFYMMPTVVTQQMYEKLMPAPAYKNMNGHIFKNAGYPVVNVNWLDAVTFANRLSAEDGLSPVYTITGTGSNRSVTADWTRSGWRLPTEAEWEYAARSGSTTPFAPPIAAEDGDGNIYIHTDRANYNGSAANTDGYNTKAGEYKEHIVVADSFDPNAWGLYNMHGNVWEFCWDWYGDYIIPAPENPRGPGTGTSNITGTDSSAQNSRNQRIIRGGSYYCSARYLRSAHRGVIAPNDSTFNDIGFRLVRNF